MKFNKCGIVLSVAFLVTGCGGGSSSDGAAQEALEESCRNDAESVACADFCVNNPESEFCI